MFQTFDTTLVSPKVRHVCFQWKVPKVRHVCEAVGGRFFREGGDLLLALRSRQQAVCLRRRRQKEELQFQLGRSTEESAAHRF